MIQVLHVTASMDFGGAETFIMNVYRKLDRNKIQFDFLVQSDKKFDYSDEIRELGGNVYVVEGRRSGIFKNRIALDNFFREHNYYDAVQLHTNCLSYIEPLIYAKKHGIENRILHAHSTNAYGNSLHRILHQINRLFLNRYATNNIACSIEAARWMFGEKRVTNNNYKIINNGIEVSRFKFDLIARKEYRRKLGIENKLVIGHVGRFMSVKNHEFLIEIFNNIIGSKINAVLVLIGEGPLKKDVELQVKNLGLEDYVKFLGKRNDVNNILSAMDFFIFPSFYEGLPLTLVEAQAAGLKCIISDNISDEVILTDNIIKMSIDISAQMWADAVIEDISNYSRLNNYKDVIESGFDSKDALYELVNIYSN